MDNKIHAVIFDMDGVLIDTEKHLIDCWIEASSIHGFEMKREEAYLLRSLTASMAEPLLQKLYGSEFDYYSVRETRKELMKERLKKFGIEKKPGVKEALTYLKEKGYKRAVATATDPVRAKQYLSEIGIYEEFDQIICASMVQIGKPMPDIYLYTCEQLHEKPQNCIAIEDSPNGVLSAYRAGMKVIMVPDLTQPEEEIARLLFAKIDSLALLHKFV